MAQVLQAIRGGIARESDRTEREAGWVAHLMNATGNYSKKAVTANSLLGRPEPPQRKMTAEEKTKLRERALRKKKRLREKQKREQTDRR